jgi:Flp pilus assembly protein TadD
MDFRYLLELKPNDPTALNALGYLMTNNTDRYSEAAALIEAAFQQEPQNPAIIDSLGWAYFKLGRFNEAEILLRQAYQSFPDPEVAAHLLELLWSQGRRVEASDLIDTEWAKSPNNPHLVDTAARLDIPLP